MNLIYFPVLYAILKQHSMMKLTRLRYATLRICSGLKCLRLYCLRLDGAYRRGLKRRMLIMVLSLQKPSEIFLSAFSYAFSHFPRSLLLIMSITSTTTRGFFWLAVSFRLPAISWALTPPIEIYSNRNTLTNTSADPLISLQAQSNLSTVANQTTFLSLTAPTR